MGFLATVLGVRGRAAILLPVVLAATAAACNFSRADVAQVPDNPVFDPDVKQVLTDHCLLCHGYPANRGAPSHFRLDVYDDVNGVRGAHAEAGEIVNAVNSGDMPPAAAWGDGVGPNGKLLLQRWLAHGAPP
jgi:hypothetical protein